jgi:iron complex outermembrane receptor protein
VLNGTKYGTTTNDKGFYEIKNIAPGEYTAVFSSIGYFADRLKVPSPMVNPSSATSS